jgi:hypothetical protein
VVELGVILSGTLPLAMDVGSDGILLAQTKVHLVRHLRLCLGCCLIDFVGAVILTQRRGFREYLLGGRGLLHLSNVLLPVGLPQGICMG